MGHRHVDPWSGLFAHRSDLERFARRLARDADEADEVEQETWSRALKSPPRQGTNLGGWLRTIARNVVRTSRRSDRALDRVDVEPSQLPDAGEEVDVEHAETLERVRLVLDGLPEPYRAALRLRFLEGRPPREIASELDCPVSTVNSRIQRGLMLMRERLDASHGGDRAAWSVVLLRGFGKRPQRLLAGSPLAPATVALLTLQLLAVVAAGAGIRSCVRSTDMGAEPAEASSDEPLALLDPVEPAGQRTALEPTPLPEPSTQPERAAAPEALDPEDRLESSLDLYVYDDSGLPIEGAVAMLATRFVTPDGLTRMRTYEKVRGTDEEGFLELPLHGRQRIRLANDAGQARFMGVWVGAEGFVGSGVLYREFPAAPGERLDVPLRRGPGLVLGTCFDSNGAPVQANVVLGPESLEPVTTLDGSEVLRGPMRLAVGPLGAFGTRAAAPGVQSYVVRATGYTSQQGTLEVRPGEVTQLDLVVQREVRTYGRLRLSNGAPAGGAKVSLVESWRPGLRDEQVVHADAAGSFEISGTREGAAWITAISADGRESRVARVEGSSSAGTEWNAVLAPRVFLELHVTDEDGRPRVGWEVSLRGAGGSLAWTRVPVDATDENGRLRVPDCPPGPLMVELFSSRQQYYDTTGSAVFVQEGLVAGPRTHHLVVPDAALVPGRVSGVVVPAHGQPLQGVQLKLVRRGSTRWLPPVFAQSGSGRFAFEGVYAGSYDLLVRSAGTGFSMLEPIEVLPGEPTEPRVLLPQPTPVRLIRTDGEPGPVAKLRIEQRVTETMPSLVEEVAMPVLEREVDEEAQVELVPGVYAWTLTRADGTRTAGSFRVQAGGAQRVLLQP